MATARTNKFIVNTYEHETNGYDNARSTSNELEINHIKKLDYSINAASFSRRGHKEG